MPTSVITYDITLQEKVVTCRLVTTEASHGVLPATFVNSLKQFALPELKDDAESLQQGEAR
jgi:hypothetical protein